MGPMKTGCEDSAGMINGIVSRELLTSFDGFNMETAKMVTADEMCTLWDQSRNLQN
jgi:hypothetical protein